MARRYTYSTGVSFGGDTPTAEFDIQVSFLVAWGRPETPPTYSHGGLPADPDEIDDIRLELVDGKPRPWNVSFGMVSDDEFADGIAEKLLAEQYDEMLIEARECEAGDRADAEERRWEDRREIGQ